MTPSATNETPPPATLPAAPTEEIAPAKSLALRYAEACDAFYAELETGAEIHDIEVQLVQVASRFLTGACTRLGVPVGVVLHWPGEENVLRALRVPEDDIKKYLATELAEGEHRYVTNVSDNVGGSEEAYSLYRSFAAEFDRRARALEQDEAAPAIITP